MSIFKKGVLIGLFVSVSISAASKEMPELIDITKVIPNIKVDCVYATTRNFTGKQIYLKPICYLLKPVAKQLAKVQKELEKQGLGLHVWDAYRPLPAQKRLWDACPDERYVAPPSKGGYHTRGIAVDLTIRRLEDGKLLEMGTYHDDFTEKAHADCPDISDEAKRNRKMLCDLMVKHGFEPYRYEWWHFNFKGWQNYPVLEVDFDVIG